MPEVIGAFLRGERIHQSANPAAEARNGPLSCFPEMGFEFAERLLDRIKVRRIFGKISQHCTGGFNQFSHAGNFVDGEAVHHHGVTALECRNKASFEIGHEGCCIHRAIKHEGRVIVFCGAPAQTKTGRRVSVALTPDGRAQRRFCAAGDSMSLATTIVCETTST